MILSPFRQSLANWKRLRCFGLRTANNAMVGKTGLWIYEDFLEVKSDLDFGIVNTLMVT